MTPQQKLGKEGEQLAVEYLIQHGYHIVERNWRFSKAEIDIIAETDNILVFVEVKTKSYTFFGEAEESIDAKKERLICDTAAAYMDKKNYEWEFRFDIISIVLNKNRGQIRHFEDAFFPGL